MSPAGALEARPAPPAHTRAAGWLLVWLLTGALMAVTIREAVHRYDTFQTGWSWDLAYYNQWYWAITQGDGVLSVRPLASYAEEGPSVWKTNYLAPVRYLIVPVYRLWPDPRTLLVVHAVVLWLAIPAAYLLVLRESDSVACGLASALLLVATPLLRPLAENDFRELQLALPFAIVAIAGVRSRSLGLACLGVAGLLACRQEFALFVATLSLVPPRAPEPISRRYRWALTLTLLGLGWLLVGFFGFLAWVVGRTIPLQYLGEFVRPRPPLLAILRTMTEFLLVGLVPWSILMLAAPRLALIALPWAWSLSAGRWALGFIATEQWHHVRYAMPLVCAVVPAGLVGMARLWNGLALMPRPTLARGILLLASVTLLAPAVVEMTRRLADRPLLVDPTEVAELWRWIGQIPPEAGVLAHYDLTAPLSSRARLYSDIMEPNRPRGYPFALPGWLTWVLIRHGEIEPKILRDQGFEQVHDGRGFEVYRRPPA